MRMSEARRDALECAAMGMYLGLCEREMPELVLAKRDGQVEFTYDGVAGFLGLAKVHLTPAGRRALSETPDDR